MLDPTANLAPASTYTVTVSAATDAAGNALAAPLSWSFTTAPAAGSCPCTIWPDTTVPTLVDSTDTNAIELGLRFRASQDGAITGVRFYKAATNTGTHVANLWTAAGAPLATATFTNETPSGWQEVRFAQPVPVTAGTSYVVSYHTTTGHYSATGQAFANGGVTNGPLTALADGAAGSNGLFLYGSGGFPTGSVGSGNYWVDVVYTNS
jgi:hypothetical protein